MRDFLEGADEMLRNMAAIQEAQDFVKELYTTPETIAEEKRLRETHLEKTFAEFKRHLPYKLSTLEDNEYLYNVIIWSKRILIEQEERWVERTTKDERERMKLFLILENEAANIRQLKSVDFWHYSFSLYYRGTFNNRDEDYNDEKK